MPVDGASIQHNTALYRQDLQAPASVPASKSLDAAAENSNSTASMEISDDSNSTSLDPMQISLPSSAGSGRAKQYYAQHSSRRSFGSPRIVPAETAAAAALTPSASFLENLPQSPRPQDEHSHLNISIDSQFGFFRSPRRSGAVGLDSSMLSVDSNDELLSHEYNHDQGNTDLVLRNLGFVGNANKHQKLQSSASDISIASHSSNGRTPRNAAGWGDGDEYDEDDLEQDPRFRSERPKSVDSDRCGSVIKIPLTQFNQNENERSITQRLNDWLFADQRHRCVDLRVTAVERHNMTHHYNVQIRYSDIEGLRFSLKTYNQQPLFVGSKMDLDDRTRSRFSFFVGPLTALTRAIHKEEQSLTQYIEKKLSKVGIRNVISVHVPKKKQSRQQQKSRKRRMTRNWAIVTLGSHEDVKRALRKKHIGPMLLLYTGSSPAQPAWRFKAGKHWPFFMLLLSLAHVALTVAMLIYGGFSSILENPLFGPPQKTLVFFGAKQGELIRQGQVYRLIVPLFLHAGLTHMLVNVLWQLSAGIFLEISWNSVATALIFFTGGLGGNIASALFNAKQVSVGASSGIAGLLGARLSSIIINWDLISPDQKLWTIAWFFVQVLFFLLLGTMPLIDNFAHVGGLFAGILAGFIFCPRTELIRGKQPGFFSFGPIASGLSTKLSSIIKPPSSGNKYTTNGAMTPQEAELADLEAGQDYDIPHIRSPTQSRTYAGEDIVAQVDKEKHNRTQQKVKGWAKYLGLRVAIPLVLLLAFYGAMLGVMYGLPSWDCEVCRYIELDWYLFFK